MAQTTATKSPPALSTMLNYITGGLSSVGQIMEDTMNNAAEAVPDSTSTVKSINNAEATHLLLEIADHGRLRNGDLSPNLTDDVPRCHHCEMPYPVARLTTQGVNRPHLCCACASRVEQLVDRYNRARGRSPRLAQSPSGRDDARVGFRTRD